VVGYFHPIFLTNSDTPHRTRVFGPPSPPLDYLHEAPMTHAESRTQVTSATAGAPRWSPRSQFLTANRARAHPRHRDDRQPPEAPGPGRGRSFDTGGATPEKGQVLQRPLEPKGPNRAAGRDRWQSTAVWSAVNPQRVRQCGTIRQVAQQPARTAPGSTGHGRRPRPSLALAGRSCPGITPAPDPVSDRAAAAAPRPRRERRATGCSRSAVEEGAPGGPDREPLATLKPGPAGPRVDRRRPPRHLGFVRTSPFGGPGRRRAAVNGAAR
jgi:hypothetical protein